MNKAAILVRAALGAVAGVTLGSAAFAQPLPDLTIADLKVNANCQIEVTIRNLGPGSLPESAMYVGSSPSLNLYRDNNSAGFWKMDKQELKPPGGTYVFVVLAANHVVSGSQNIRAEIDSSKLVTEANENNNALARTLTCSPKLPDLVVDKIEFAPADCRTVVTLKNAGTGTLQTNLYGGIYVKRKVDGADKGTVRLSDMDPGKALAAPGGKATWTDFADMKPKQTVTFTIAGLDTEASTANNAATASLPARCTKLVAPAVPATRMPKSDEVPKQVPPKPVPPQTR